jgi:hypothetical protein
LLIHRSFVAKSGSEVVEVCRGHVAASAEPSHVAAEARLDVGPNTHDHPAASRAACPALVRRARTSLRGNGTDGTSRAAAGAGTSVGVPAADAAEGGDPGRGLQAAQRVGLDVPGRVAAGDHDARCRHACPS